MADIADLASDYQQRLNDEALARLPRAPLDHIVDAAELVERDCAGCGDPIPAARLAIVPHARHCVECQERNEAR
jgi:phage/conjugal plasmid C-4 type zinc finger TraR family protein